MNLFLSVIHYDDCMPTFCSNNTTASNEIHCDACLSCSSLDFSPTTTEIVLQPLSYSTALYIENSPLRLTEWIQHIDRPPIV